MSDRFLKALLVACIAVISIGFLSAVFTAEYIVVQSELHSPATVKP